MIQERLRAPAARCTTRAALADWSERAIMDEEFDDRDLDTIRDITGRLGRTDARPLI